MIIISVFLQNDLYIIMLYNHSLSAAKKDFVYGVEVFTT